MKIKKLTLAAMVAAIAGSLLFTGCGDNKKENKSKNAEGWNLADTIVEDVSDHMPKFDDYEVNIKDFGAEVLDAKLTDKTEEAQLSKKNTEAINKAIADVTAHKGGGKVIIPAGYTYTGAIHLDNNVNLHLEDDSYVMFTTDYSQYPNVLTRWEGVVCYNYSPMIYAYQKENVAVTGNGVLDGQATKEEYWLPWKNKDYLPDETQDEDQKALRQMGEDNVDFEEREFGQGHYLRPSFLQTYECKNVLIEGITINNAPFWMVHPVFSEYVTIRQVNVESHGYNNDGINPDSCKNVVIDDCDFNTGDDCVAIKSGRDNDGRTIGIKCENIVVQNNTYYTGKGTCATIGSEMSGGVKNIFFRDNESKDTVEHLQAISFKTTADRGGTVEKVYIKGTKAANVVDRAVLITMHYEEGDTGKTTPKFKDIYIEDCDIVAKDTSDIQDTIAILGYARSPIENVHFKNCTIDCGKDAPKFNFVNVDGVFFEGCTINGEKYPDGEYVPSAENFTVLKEEVKSTSINVMYSSGAIEDEGENMSWRWEVSDSADGKFSPVADQEENEKVYHFLGITGGKMSLKKANTSEKYYRLIVTINGEEWTSDVYHKE